VIVADESHEGSRPNASYHDRVGYRQERVSGSRDRRGQKVVVRKQLRRRQVVALFEALPPCLIGMEACATAHYWARELTKLGHTVRLMPAKDVKAYVKRNKNDAADAEAICEAVRRPTMRFVQIKSSQQQGRLMQHRARDLLMRQRTQVINALRAHLAELGITAAQGSAGLKELLGIIAGDADERLPADATTTLDALEQRISYLEDTIASITESSQRVSTHQLCVADDSGAETCLTKSQLDALLTGQPHAAEAAQPATPAGVELTPPANEPAALVPTANNPELPPPAASNEEPTGSISTGAGPAAEPSVLHDPETEGSDDDS
jgi:hypothetical protein